jgi:2-oxo-4-hydroxy-4-carboxy--5-ureidoimidazoline (OHCU) decarboxylase
VEQGGDEPEEVYVKLAELNQQYEEHFGFPFVIFVNGYVICHARSSNVARPHHTHYRRPKSEICRILDAMMSRKESLSHDQELERALNDLFAIAEDRLSKATVGRHSSL